MTRAVAPRGPDAEGFWIAPGVALGHRRLKIIDLSDAAAQPMGNADGSVQVVFNGEIYNFADLRAELLGHGHQFRSRSDTEVIVHGYAQWGDGVLDRLHGMFAFGAVGRAPPPLPGGARSHGQEAVLLRPDPRARARRRCSPSPPS